MREKWQMFCDGYSVSNLGRVYSHKSHMIMKPNTLKKGYKQIKVYVDGEYVHFYIHILVARNFIGPCPEGKEVNHKDLDKGNNRWTNLEYLTRSGNLNHAVDNGFVGRQILTWKDVHRIRRLYGGGRFTYKKLGRKFGISAPTIGDIVNYRTWDRG